MSRETLTERRQRFRSKLFTYEERKEEAKAKILYYRQILDNLNINIYNWGKAIERIDITTDKLRRLEEVVVQFTHTHIKRRGYRKLEDTEAYRLTKLLFYRMGLEKGIKGTELLDYVEGKDRKEVFRNRVIRTIESDPKNKQAWVNFKEYYESRTKYLPK